MGIIDINEPHIEQMEALRAELLVLRAKARVSQETIASIIGVSRQTYGSVETGKKEMTRTLFLALVAYFQNNDDTRQMIVGILGRKDSEKRI